MAETTSTPLRSYADYLRRSGCNHVFIFKSFLILTNPKSETIPTKSPIYTNVIQKTCWALIPSHSNLSALPALLKIAVRLSPTHKTRHVPNQHFSCPQSNGTNKLSTWRGFPRVRDWLVCLALVCSVVAAPHSKRNCRQLVQHAQRSAQSATWTWTVSWRGTRGELGREKTRDAVL